MVYAPSFAVLRGRGVHLSFFMGKNLRKKPDYADFFLYYF